MVLPEAMSEGNAVKEPQRAGWTLAIPCCANLWRKRNRTIAETPSNYKKNTIMINQKNKLRFTIGKNIKIKGKDKFRLKARQGSKYFEKFRLRLKARFIG